MSTHVPGADPALDAQTRVPQLVGTAIAFGIISTVTVLLRAYTRYFVVHAPGIDDYCMLVAMVVNIGVSATTILQAEHGLGHHVWLVHEADSMIQFKALFAGEVFYNLVQILTKISFLLQYRRIFRDDLTRNICFWLIMFFIAWGITQEFLVGLACIPVSYFVPSRADKCIYSLIVWYLTSIMNIVTDFVIFLVPIRAIRSLQLPLRQKLMVMSLFCLGFFTCVMSIVRLFTLRAALSSTDPTWDNSPTSWWSTIELNCGIICSNIATLRPLIRSVRGKGPTINRTDPTGGYHRHTSPHKSGIAVDQTYTVRYMKSSDSQNELNEDVTDGIDQTSHGSLASYELTEAGGRTNTSGHSGVGV